MATEKLTIRHRLNFHFLQQQHTLKVLVLSLQCLQLIQSLLIRVLHLEQFSAEGARLLQGSFQLRLAFFILLFQSART